MRQTTVVSSANLMIVLEEVMAVQPCVRSARDEWGKVQVILLVYCYTADEYIEC